MPTPTPIYSRISQQKASFHTPGLRLHLVFTRSALVQVQRIHLPLLVHPLPPPRPLILLHLPRLLVPPIPIPLVPCDLVHRHPIPHQVSGPPSTARAIIVVNGVINDVIAMPRLTVLALDLVPAFPLSLDPLHLLDPMFTSCPLVPIASLKSIRETLPATPLIVLNTVSTPIALVSPVTIDVTSVLDVRLTSVLPLTATHVPLPVTMNLTSTQMLTSMEVSRVLRTTLE